MGQRRDFLGHELTVLGHISGANLQQVIEMSCDHMRLFNLGHSRHGGVKSTQGRIAGIAEPDLDECHMIQSQPDRV
ncbi:hypothetical protein SAMN04488523_10754 [Sulfitobacter brevis]|uniref:Uncharacterized protein n=1 Tax=Sulfitobacter brevis TaxID=74348 RepID=A0A1I2ADG6_9RHOB|nr:hypothetical protein SAMN04488523_10754 [Sulfitobacter brevis]